MSDTLSWSTEGRRSDPECKSPAKEVAGGVGSGFVVVYMRAIPARESFTISRKWLALGEALPGSARHPDVKASENKRPG